MAPAPEFDSDSQSDSSAFDDGTHLLPLNGQNGGDNSHLTPVNIEPLGQVGLQHSIFNTSFTGVVHHASIPNAEVHQFRGLKYASVPKRFRHSTLFENYPPALDATKYGPICPQVKNRWLETRLYGLPPEIIPTPSHIPAMDEFECCNLTVTTPSPASLARLRGSTKTDLLPVLVWIHGGGNVTGSGSHWVWDAGALVRRSIQIRKPVVAVALNFRLGLFGFGASEALREDNKAAGEDGVGNYGLHDQRVALKWIRKYIAGFGGDPNNVTLFGSSWGAADIHAHLLSEANHQDVTGPPDSDGPLFHRAILQSGALVPSISVVQDVYTAGRHMGRILASLQLSTIDELRAVPAMKLVQLTGEHVRPVDDGVFLRQDWKTLSLPFSTTGRSAWRQDVIIGDVACESVLWAIPAKLWGADAVARRARAIVQSVRRADALMRAYEIFDDKNNEENAAPLNGSAIADDDDEECTSSASASGSEEGEGEIAERVMELMNDVAFAWPVDVAARSAADSAFVFEDLANGDSTTSLSDSSVSSSETSPSITSNGTEITVTGTAEDRHVRLLNAPYVYRYVFDQASPYTQTPHHGVDLLYLFGNIPFPSDPDFTPEENEEVNWDRVKVREEMQGRWLAFAYGEEPWDPLKPNPPASVAAAAANAVFPTPMLSPVASFAFGHNRSKGFLESSPPESTSSSRTSSFTSNAEVQHMFQRATSFSNTQLIHPHHHHHHSPHHYQHHPRSASTSSQAGPQKTPLISISEADKVFVFGPEGETGTRSAKIFAGRRRVHAWREALAPLGLATAQKVGLELGNGPVGRRV